MRAVTIAAASAVLLGSTVAAGSHVQNMHKQLHARDDWNDWSSDGAAASTPADLTTKPEYTKPADLTTKPAKPETTPAAETTPASSAEETWSGWDGEESSTPADKKTSSKPLDITKTSSKPADSTTTSYEVTWEDWSSTSTPAATTTSSSDPWEDWESATSSTPADITSTSTDPWEDWESATSSTPAVVTSTDPVWSDWAESTAKSGTTTTTIYLGEATDPSWGDWASSTSSTPADLTSATPTTWADWSTTPAASSSTPAWSSDGWFGPGWGNDGSCAVQVVTSYGSPVWSATPNASLPVLSVTVSPTAPADTTAAASTWADWSATSTPADVTTSSYDPSETWADWTSSTTPAAETTTSYDPSQTWADWSSSAASSTPTGSSSGNHGSIGTSGNTWGMTYSPYTSQGGCKDAGTVAQDLAVIAGKGFSTVRVYSTDCSTLENVGKSARDNGLKLILGVFISSTGINGAREQVWDIIGWAQWDLVELIVVGNEATFNGYCSAGELAGFIGESKGFFQKAGYTGPVTTTEPLAEWTKEGSAFCSVIDVVAANLYAFFNAEVTADKAGDFISRQLTELEQVCPGKDTYVMESGWPHAGNCNGAACPSPENQATALKSIESVTGSKVIFFSYEDEAWKEPGQFGVEQYWGCASVF